MNVKKVAVLLALACMLLVAVACGGGVTKPTVSNIPQGWYLSTENDYGTYQEVDGTKWGLVEYTDSDDYDGVQIFYGDIPPELEGRETDGSALTGRAVLEAVTFDPDEVGTMTVAGHLAGYAKAYDATTDVYEIEIVFVEGNTCIDIYAMYDANAADEAQVMSLINSIEL